VAAALCGCGADITFARVLTFGQDVVDTFYVRDARTGGKLADVERLRRAVLAAVS
jgi:UTP:GlnB (protein PII) uridylyltransferase